MKSIRVVGIDESGREREGTEYVIEQLKDSGKWIVYDTCLEDIQSDGDGFISQPLETWEDAVECAISEAKELSLTYEDIFGKAKITRHL